MSVNEEALRRLVMELQILQEKAESLQSRMGLTNSALNELHVVTDTIEGLKQEKKGSLILVPIGGGSYLKAKIEDSKRLIVGIGANVAAEKSVDEAQEGYQTRLLRLETVRKSLQQQLEETVTRITNTRNRAQTLSEQLKEGKGNV